MMRKSVKASENSFEMTCHCRGVDWAKVPRLLQSGGMAYHSSSVHRKAFEKSAAVVFLYCDKKLIGFGRAISDGEYQSAIYDVVVAKEYQGRGFGWRIMKELLRRLPKRGNVILYASPGKEGFYKKLGFGRMKTGMALFCDMEKMKEMRFVA